MDRDYQWRLPEQSGRGVELWDEVLARASRAEAARQTDVPEDPEMEKEKEAAARRESNPASTYAPQGTGAKLIWKYGGAPWIPPDRRYDPGCAGLHQEILDFVNWSRPTPDEHKVRMEVFRSLDALIRSLWPNAAVDFFGSFRTGLFLPTSDIDMVVMGEWDGPGVLWALEAALKESGLTLPNSIKVLDKASVPIVKLQHARTRLHVDISFNMRNGVPSAALIIDYIAAFPVLPYLVYVLKHFLLQRDLNEVFTGGLSSYSLILMSISFLQLHAARRLVGQKPEALRTNLAVLLLEFLELYGRQFNYVSTAIRLVPQPSYTPKEELQREMADGHRPSMLSIQDPLQPTNDIGRSCYGAMRVRQAFEWAFLTLSRALIHPAPHFSDHPSGSLLTRIIRVTDAVVDYRAFLKTLLSSPQPLPLADSTASAAQNSPEQTSDNANARNGDEKLPDPEPTGPATASYASVVSSQLTAVRRGPRNSSKRSGGRTGAGRPPGERSRQSREGRSRAHAAPDEPPQQRRTRGVSTSSELSSDSESDSESETSDGSGSGASGGSDTSRRSYSSVASSNLGRDKASTGSQGPTRAASALDGWKGDWRWKGEPSGHAASVSTAGGSTSGLRRREESRKAAGRPPKPPSPAPSSDSAAGSSGHRNNYRRDRRRQGKHELTPPQSTAQGHTIQHSKRQNPSPRRSSKTPT